MVGGFEVGDLNGVFESLMVLREEEKEGEEEEEEKVTGFMQSI